MIALHQGQVLAGRYRLEREMAQGGMGQVWIARHLQLDIDVAVKLMAPALAGSTELRGRFEREAKAAALLKSANVVQVFDYGVDEGTPYMVMELLEGEDLHARLRREGCLTPAATAAILVPICKALRRAHEVGLVHRDLKPSNVFLERQGGDQVVKILDFGIVKDTGLVLRVARTTGLAIMGSPRYMSPEQATDSTAVDHRGDLWALGMIAFRCLVGRFPSCARDAGLVLEALHRGDAAVPMDLATGLGRDVDAFFERALAIDPALRFQSAAELAGAFVSLEWPAGERTAVEASPPPTPSPGKAVDVRTLIAAQRSKRDLPAAAVARPARSRRLGEVRIILPAGVVFPGPPESSGAPAKDEAEPEAKPLPDPVVRSPLDTRRRRRIRWTRALFVTPSVALAMAMLFSRLAPAASPASPSPTAALMGLAPPALSLPAFAALPAPSAPPAGVDAGGAPIVVPFVEARPVPPRPHVAAAPKAPSALVAAKYDPYEDP